MANTLVVGEHGYTVVFDGSTAFDAALELPSLPTSGQKIRSIQIIPAATDDTVTVREASATGRIMTKLTCADVYDTKVKYFDNSPERKRKVYVKSDECTASAMMIVEL